MPTEKPRVTITMSKETLEKVDDFRFKNRIKTQSKAIIQLMLAGLEDMERQGIIKKVASSISDEAMRLAKDYDELDTWGQKQVRSTVDIEKARCDEASSRPRAIPDNIIPFRRSIQPVSAGTGAYLGPEEFETIFVMENELTRRASFGVTVRGDSMEPSYHDGDILIVEGAEDIDVGEVGVFTVDGDGYVKERGEDALISLNPNYDPVKLTEDSRCNGRVIGVLAPEWIVEY